MREAVNEIDDKKLRVNRKNFPCRDKPYYKTIESGISIGYFIKEGAEPKWTLRTLISETGEKPRYSIVNIGICDDGNRKSSLGNIDTVIRRSNDALNLQKIVKKETLTYNQVYAIARHFAGAPKQITKEDELLTIKQAVSNYKTARTTAGKSARSIKNDAYVLQAHVVRKLGHIRVGDLTLTQLEAWMASLPGTNANANRIRASFVALLNLAADKLELTRRCWDKLKRRVEDSENEFVQDKYLTLEQVRHWISCGENQEIRDLMTFCALTGYRLGEIREIRVGDVQGSQVNIRCSKTGRRISVLTNAALALLGRLGEGKKAGDYYFTHPKGHFWKIESHHRYMERSVIKAKLPAEEGLPPVASLPPDLSYTFKTLRSIYITRVVKEGIDIATTAKLTGTSIKMIQKNYFELALDETATRLNKLETL